MPRISLLIFCSTQVLENKEAQTSKSLSPAGAPEELWILKKETRTLCFNGSHANLVVGTAAERASAPVQPGKNQNLPKGSIVMCVDLICGYEAFGLSATSALAHKEHAITCQAM